jgi:hypothetical protein
VPWGRRSNLAEIGPRGTARTRYVGIEILRDAGAATAEDAKDAEVIV